MSVPQRSAQSVKYFRIRLFWKVSFPAGTGVWVVKTVLPRQRSNAFSKEIFSLSTRRWIRSNPRKAEWPSFICQTEGEIRRASSTRTPPIPRRISWQRRISLPATYRIEVIGRSWGRFSSRSLSSSRTGARPIWAFQAFTWTRRPGKSTETRSSFPSGPATGRTGSRFRS